MTQRNPYWTGSLKRTESFRWIGPHASPDRLPPSTELLEMYVFPHRHSLAALVHSVTGFKMWNYWLKWVIFCLFDRTNGSMMPRHSELYFYIDTITQTQQIQLPIQTLTDIIQYYRKWDTDNLLHATSCCCRKIDDRVRNYAPPPHVNPLLPLKCGIFRNILFYNATLYYYYYILLLSFCCYKKLSTRWGHRAVYHFGSIYVIVIWWFFYNYYLN